MVPSAFKQVWLSKYTETVIPIIASYQTDFIPGRQSFYNMCELFNVLYSSHSAQQAEVVLSLDAVKAFNRLNGSTFLLLWKDFHLAHHSLHGSYYFMQPQRHQVWTNSICSDDFLFHTRLLHISICIYYWYWTLGCRAEKKTAGIVRGGSDVHNLLLYVSNQGESVTSVYRYVSPFWKPDFSY